MRFYRRDAVSPSAVRVHPGAVIPRSEARDPRERIGAALAGISAEVAELPWDWRERTADERAQDHFAPLTAQQLLAPPGAVVPLPGPPERYVGVRDGQYVLKLPDARA